MTRPDLDNNSVVRPKITFPRGRQQSLVWLAERLRPHDLVNEKDLLTLKWFAYRFLSPLRATLLFANEYRAAYKRHIAFHDSLDRATGVMGFNTYDIWKDRGVLTSIWRARQHADAVGMDYRNYLDFCFEFTSLSNRKRPPRPNQLRPSGEKQEAAWFAKFHFDRAERTLLTINRWLDTDAAPQYRIEAYAGLPAQDQYRKDLINLLLNTNRRPSDAIRKWYVEQRQLPVRSMLSIAGGRDGLRLAIRSVRSDLEISPASPPPFIRLEDVSLHQSCYGLPFAHDPQVSPCDVCPQSDGCKTMAGQVLALVRQHHGVDNPARERDRQMRNARRRKSYAKVKGTGFLPTEDESVSAGTCT